MSRRIPHPHPQGHGRSPNYLWMALGQARARHSRHASARMDARPQAHSHAANPAGCWVLRPAQEQAGKTTGTPAGCHIAKPANFPKAKKPRRSGHEALVVGCPYGINEEFVTVEVRTGSQQQKKELSRPLAAHLAGCLRTHLRDAATADCGKLYLVIQGRRKSHACVDDAFSKTC